MVYPINQGGAGFLPSTSTPSVDPRIHHVPTICRGTVWVRLLLAVFRAFNSSRSVRASTVAGGSCSRTKWKKVILGCEFLRAMKKNRQTCFLPIEMMFLMFLTCGMFHGLTTRGMFRDLFCEKMEFTSIKTQQNEI